MQEGDILKNQRTVSDIVHNFAIKILNRIENVDPRVSDVVVMRELLTERQKSVQRVLFRN